jgi:hypothetical protein
MLQLLLRRLLEDIKRLADVKVPVVDLACVLDEVGPPVLAAQLISKLDTLDDCLGRFRSGTCTRDHPSAQLDALLQRLEPDGTSDAGQFLQALCRELDYCLENRVGAPALAWSVALAIWVCSDCRRIVVCIAIAGHRRGVFAVLAAGPKTVAAGRVEVVATETLLGEQLVELVVLIPCCLTTVDRGVGVLRLGKDCSEDQWECAGKSSGGGKEVVEGDHCVWVKNCCLCWLGRGMRGRCLDGKFVNDCSVMFWIWLVLMKMEYSTLGQALTLICAYSITAQILVHLHN